MSSRGVPNLSAEVSSDEILKDRELTVTASIESIGNSGIGAYECHGYRGYDRGVDFVEEYEIDAIEVDGVDVPFSKAKTSKFQRLANLVHDNEKFGDRIIEALTEALSEDDGPDCDDQSDEE